jgi:anti-sigma-K factor RskA
MRCSDPNLRDRLAAEFVMGLMQPRTARRFELMLRQDPDLRRRVASWRGVVGRVTDSLPPEAPPKRVWRGIEARLDGPAKRPAVSPWWRALGLGASALAGVLAAFLVLRPAPPPAPVPGPDGFAARPWKVAVLSDQASRAAWVTRYAAGGRELVLVALDLPERPANKDYELWMLPGGERPPRSLGLIPERPRARLSLSEGQTQELAAADGLAVSLEPRGGSPTGLPTGPVLYQAELLSL